MTGLMGAVGALVGVLVIRVAQFNENIFVPHMLSLENRSPAAAHFILVHNISKQVHGPDDGNGVISHHHAFLDRNIYGAVFLATGLDSPGHLIGNPLRPLSLGKFSVANNLHANGLFDDRSIGVSDIDDAPADHAPSSDQGAIDISNDQLWTMGGVKFLIRQLQRAHGGLMLSAPNPDQPKSEPRHSDGGQGAEGAVVPVKESGKPYPDWLGWLLWGSYLGFPLICGWAEGREGGWSRAGRWGMYGWLASFATLPLLMAIALR